MREYETVEGVLMKTSSVEEKPIEWIIYGLIPKKELTIIGGDGGAGKGFMYASLVASITTGKPLLGLHEFTTFEDVKPKIVAIFSAEDTITHTVKARLRNAGADLDKVYAISLENEFLSELKFGSQKLDEQLRIYKPDVAIFDPLQAFLPPSIQMGVRNQMRDIMTRFLAVCNKYNITPIIIMHTNKGQGISGRQRLADSSDIWDISRSVFIVGNCPGEKNLKYFSHEKSTHSRNAETVLFSIEGNKAVFDSFTYKRDYEFMQELKGLKSTERRRETPKKDEAKEAIMQVLRDYPEGIESKTLKEIVTEYHEVSEKSYNIARAELKENKTITVKRTGKGANCKSLVIPLLYI